MVSSLATMLLLPQAVSFFRRQPPKPVTTPPLRWNPLFVRNSFVTKSLFLHIPVHAKFVRVRSSSSSFDAVEAEAEEEEKEEVKRKPTGGRGLLSSVIEALGESKGPALAAVLSLGLFLADASASAALSVAASDFPCHPSSSSSWCHSALSSSCSHCASSPLLGADRDNSLLSLLMLGSAAVTLLTGFLSDPMDEGNDPKLQVSIIDSLPRALDWIGENTKTSFLEGLRSMLTDYFTSQNYFRNQLDAPGVSCLKGRKLGLEWNDQICISRKLNFERHYLDNKHRHLMKAVTTSTPACLVPSEYDTKLLLGSDLDAHVVQIQPSNDETPEVDDRERLRRMRISKANRGNVPWNKGRKHSAETLQRIRERTKLAMQDPKVKMKLVNLGHAQSEETRVKIGAGVREGWRRRHEKLKVQEGCLFEWQNNIAESARNGCTGDDELQWDSYKTLDKQLKQQWLESIERRKKVPRPKGSRRAPKSPEQRRKISEAISAKWADEGYRARVCNAMANYHGTTIGAERSRRKPGSETPVRDTIKKKTIKSNSISHDDRSIKKAIPKRRRNSTPVYKDPLASFKLEIIKKIREERAAKEAKQATKRAKLLIAEAEKAAKALEMAALKSPLAQASLLETRKLIAEATQSIENIESGTLTRQDFVDKKYLDSSRPLNHFQSSSGVPSTEKFNERLVNGFHLLPSSRINHKDIDFDKLSLNGQESLTATESTEKSAESRLPLHTKSVEKGSEKASNQTSQSVASRFIKYEDNSEEEDIGISEVKNSVPSRTFAVKLKKKWVRGRLVEVEENEVAEEDSIQGSK